MNLCSSLRNHAERFKKAKSVSHEESSRRAGAQGGEREPFSLKRQIPGRFGVAIRSYIAALHHLKTCFLQSERNVFSIIQIRNTITYFNLLLNFSVLPITGVEAPGHHPVVTGKKGTRFQQAIDFGKKLVA